MIRYRSLIVFAIVATTSTSVGCGGSGSLSKAEFIKKADAICNQESRKGEARILFFVETHHFSLATITRDPVQGFKMVREIIIPNYQSQIRQIRALGLPSEERGQLKLILNGMQRVVDEAKKRPEKFYSSEPFGNALVAKKSTSRRAYEYGFKVCAASRFSYQPAHPEG